MRIETRKAVEVFVGVDPDLTRTGWAVVGGGQIWVGCVKAKSPTIGALKTIPMIDGMKKELPSLDPSIPTLVAVEGQQKYAGKGRATPGDLLNLARVTGAALAILSEHYRVAPTPGEWSRVPKSIRLSRMYSRLEWPTRLMAGYSAPIDPPCHVGQGVFSGDWKHIGDALALALWARDSYKHEPNLSEDMEIRP